MFSYCKYTNKYYKKQINKKYFGGSVGIEPTSTEPQSGMLTFTPTSPCLQFNHIP